jgi:prevent-host-death family protein
MQDINITELRKHLPSYLKRVARGEQIRVTRNGKVLARIVPEGDPGTAARIRLEALRGTMVVGDIVSPIDDVEWSADDDYL